MHSPRLIHSIIALAAGVTTLLPTAESFAQGSNLVVNGSFADDASGWWQTGNLLDGLSVSSAGLCVNVPAGTVNPWDAIIGQGGLPLTAGTGYRFSFTASGSEVVGIKALIGEPDADYREFSTLTPTLGPTPQTFEQSFTMGESSQIPQVAFQIGGSELPWTFCVDDVVVAPLGTELVVNGDFENGLDGWWNYGDLSDLDTSTGALCGTAGPSANVWDAGIGQTVALEAGVTYEFGFSIEGDPDRIHATVQYPVTYAEPIAFDVFPTASGDSYSGSFTAPESAAGASLVFQVGGAAASRSFCIDGVSLLGGASVPPYEPDTGPRVRVNQTAYVSHGPKFATLVTDVLDPLAWQLLDSTGSLVSEGQSEPFGTDASSGLTVHTIDFSALSEAGAGYVLVADGESSYPFAIGGDPYESLRTDALRVFYTNRSGVEIDGAVAGDGYARPAGHASSPADGVPNQGDFDVPCQPADDSLPIYGEPWTCDYTLDVTGGWYDAGDHGKYVVNGGISVFQLLNTFERTKLAPSADLGALADGTLRVPEVGNGVPDILDEARFELEFMLSMQVPAGKPLAGMVHHKVHDSAWTGLPLLPDQDAMLRWLHRPSTAATLNLAAAAAQAARIYAPYDHTFSRRLLKAARTAWAAALKYPDLYAPLADGASGGGAYDDADVSDEFYWAATELYLTTGERQFKDFLTRSPLNTADVFPASGLSWGSVAALARMELATVPSELKKRSVVDSVVTGALGYLADQRANGFGQPYAPEDAVYVWGSNSQVLNNLVVLATAYDLTNDESFRRGVLEGIDYVLGRNAVNVSFVTGYGSIFSQNQHNRWYANQLDPSLPHPPLGTLSGGPNSTTATWDPTIQRLYGAQGCDPQFCYVDDVNSWSTNELAINWNSALTWVASFLADQDAADGKPFGSCKVKYKSSEGNGKKFHAKLELTNTGKKALRNWQLSFAFIGDQTVDDDDDCHRSGTRVSMDGASVTLKPASSHDQIRPGDSVKIELNGKNGELVHPEPTTFFLNGEACRVE